MYLACQLVSIIIVHLRKILLQRACPFPENSQNQNNHTVAKSFRRTMNFFFYVGKISSLVKNFHINSIISIRPKDFTYQFILCCQSFFLVSLKFDTTDTADDTTLYSKCDQASDLWQELKLVSKLESDLGDTID